MSKSESRQTEKQVLVRMSEEDYATIQSAMEAVLDITTGVARTERRLFTTSMPRFLLMAALDKADAILKEARGGKKK